MNFWNNPEYAPLKVLIIAVIAGVGGGFIYTSMNHGDTGRVINTSALSGTSMTSSSTSVASLGTAGTGTIPSLTTGTTGTTGGTSAATTSGTTAGTTSGVTTGGAVQGGTTDKGTTDKGTTTGVDGVGTTDGRESPCSSTAPIALASVLGMPATPSQTMVFVGPSVPTPTAPARWLNFTLRNPSECPVVVTQASIRLSTNDMTVWPPVQYVKLMQAGVQLGDAQEDPSNPGTITTGPATLVFTSSTAHPFAVMIPAHGTRVFSVMSASQNVNANEYGGATPPSTSATGATTPGTGTPVYFKMQLTQFTSHNSVSGAVSNQTTTSPGAFMIPGSIVTPIINIYN